MRIFGDDCSTGRGKDDGIFILTPVHSDIRQKQNYGYKNRLILNRFPRTLRHLYIDVHHLYF